MLKTAKMELLRVLVSECLSAAAQEIFKIVERTIIEHEEDVSCSKWVVDSHHRLLDVAKSHIEDSLQMSAIDVKVQSGQQQPPASVDISVCWEPKNTTEPTEDCHNINNIHPDSSLARDNDESDQQILIDVEDDDVEQQSDQNMPLKTLKVKKPFKCPICLSVFSSKKTMVRHFKKHPEDQSSLYQCWFCDQHFWHKSDCIIHTRTHKAAKPYKYQDCDTSVDQEDSRLLHRQKHTEEKSYQCFSEEMVAETHLRSVTPAVKIEEVSDCRQDKSNIKTFPLTITPYDRSEFEQESLQPLCLYQIQTVADIDKNSTAAVPVDHIKSEPSEADCGVSENTPDDLPLLSVNPSELAEGETEPKHLNINNISPRRPSGKSAKLIVPFEGGTAQKPFKCPCCAKCFSLTKTLLRHIKVHREDKPYQCQFCGRNFCQKSDLVNHTRIHTGERPYQCPECHKSFAQKGNLVVHMRKHTGEKDCSFGQKSSLEYHRHSYT